MGNKPIKPVGLEEKLKDIEKLNTLTLEEVLLYNKVLYDSDILPFNNKYIKKCVVGQQAIMFVFMLNNGEIYATRHLGFRKLNEKDYLLVQKQQHKSDSSSEEDQQIYQKQLIEHHYYNSAEEAFELLCLRKNERFPLIGNKASSKHGDRHTEFDNAYIRFSEGINVYLHQNEGHSPSYVFRCHGIDQYFLHGNHPNLKEINNVNQLIKRIMVLQLHSMG